MRAPPADLHSWFSGGIVDEPDRTQVLRHHQIGPTVEIVVRHRGRPGVAPYRQAAFHGGGSRNDPVPSPAAAIRSLRPGVLRPGGPGKKFWPTRHRGLRLRRSPAREIPKAGAIWASREGNHFEMITAIQKCRGGEPAGLQRGGFPGGRRAASDLGVRGAKRRARWECVAELGNTVNRMSARRTGISPISHTVGLQNVQGSVSSKSPKATFSIPPGSEP